MSTRDTSRKHELLGLFEGPDQAADAVSKLRGVGFGDTDFEIISQLAEHIRVA